MAITDYNPVDTTVSSYDADQRDVNAQTDTVQGQMTGLLDSNSDYMKQAATKGMQYAAGRGLLNSSIGATASQSAAIDAALPIAQQDADQSWRTTENEADRGLTRWQVGAEQEGAMDRLVLSEESQTSRAAASDAASMERTKYSELSATERNKDSNLNSMTIAQLQDAGLTERQLLSNENSVNLQKLSDAGAMDRVVQQGDLDWALNAMKESSATARNDTVVASNEKISAAELALEKLIKGDTLDQQDKANFSSSYLDMTSTYTDYIYSIKVDSVLEEPEKNRLIQERTNDYNYDLKLMSVLYGVNDVFK